MKLTKGDLIKKLNEGKTISEIIDGNLNIIGSDEVDTPEQVKNNSTTNSYIDASTIQMGKNRLTTTTFLEEDGTPAEASPISIDNLRAQFPIVSRNLDVLIDSMRDRSIDVNAQAIIVDTLLNNIDLQGVKQILRSKLG